MPPPRIITVRPEDIDHAATSPGGRTVSPDEIASADDPQQSWPSWLLDQGIDALPMAGGLAGGIVGGVGGTVGGFGVGGPPAALAGAMLGGAGGEGFKQAINQYLGRTPVFASNTDALKDVGLEGAKQGAYELGGQGLGWAAPKVGAAIYESALGKLPEKILSQFPNVADVLVKNRFPISEGGRAAAVIRRGQAGQATRALLQRAQEAGVTFDAGQVVEKPLLDLIDALGAIPAGSAEEKALGNYIDDYLARHPGPLSPQALKDMKQAAQQISDPIMKAESMGNVVGAEANTYGKFNKAVATGAQNALETKISTEAGFAPGMAAAEGETKDMIGAARAIKAAAGKGYSLPTEMSLIGASGALAAALSPTVRGKKDAGLPRELAQGVIEYMVTRGMASRYAISKGALALTAPQTAAIFRQFPRVAAYVVGQLQQQNAPTQSTISIDRLGQ